MSDLEKWEYRIQRDQLLDEIEQLTDEIEEQARLLDMSATRELNLKTEIERLHHDVDTLADANTELATENERLHKAIHFAIAQLAADEFKSVVEQDLEDALQDKDDESK